MNFSDMNLSKMFSDIKVVHQFSPNEAYDKIPYDQRASYSVMETSLISEIKLWEQICDVDKTTIIKVEKGFQDIDVQIQSLATQFDICFTLQQKAEEKLVSYQKLIKGTMFTKFSRSNCRKTMPRNVYYCPYWDAICWKPSNERYSKQTQMIYLSQILQVHTNLQQYQLKRKNFKLPQWADQDCFLAIEAKRDTYLELLAPSIQIRNLYVRAFDSLIQNQGFGTETNFLVTQYGTDVNNIRRTLDSTKQFLNINLEKLKKSFVQTTCTMLNEERLRSKKIRHKTKQIMEKNQASVEELQYENENLTTQVIVLEEELDCVQVRYQQSKSHSNSFEMNEIFKLTKDILILNGDCSMESTSGIGSYQESILNLQKVKVLQETSHYIEIQLRQDLQDQQDHFQTQIVEARQIYNKIQYERDDLLMANEELAMKMDEFQIIIEQKEEQFSEVINDMREMQGTIKDLMAQSKLPIVDQFKQENDKLKQIMKKKLQQFKQQVVVEEQQSSILFSQILSLLSCLIVPQDQNLSPELVVKQLCNVLPNLGSPQIKDNMIQMVQSIGNKIQLYMSNDDYKQTYMDALKEGMLCFKQINNKKKFSSPQITLQSGGSILNSPSCSSWRDPQVLNQTYF